jgi:hypothetical protein
VHRLAGVNGWGSGGDVKGRREAGVGGGSVVRVRRESADCWRMDRRVG